MFTLPLVESAKMRGVSLIVAATTAEFLEHLQRDTITAVLLDMRLTTPEVVSHLSVTLPKAAFGPHVEGDSFLALRRLGVQEVWPNSKLAQKFPAWLDRMHKTDPE